MLFYTFLQTFQVFLRNFNKENASKKYTCQVIDGKSSDPCDPRVVDYGESQACFLDQEKNGQRGGAAAMPDSVPEEALGVGPLRDRGRENRGRSRDRLGEARRRASR